MKHNLKRDASYPNEWLSVAEMQAKAEYHYQQLTKAEQRANRFKRSCEGLDKAELDIDFHTHEFRFYSSHAQMYNAA